VVLEKTIKDGSLDGAYSLVTYTPTLVAAIRKHRDPGAVARKRVRRRR